MPSQLVKDLLEAGVHFGHQTRRWNPRMRRFIFGARKGIYIIDLEKTAEGLVQACDFARQVGSEGGQILIVGTKPQAQAVLKEEAARCNMPYVIQRWLGGTLTNFSTIRKSVTRYQELCVARDSDELDRTKKETARMEKEIGRLETSLGGVLSMEKLPKAVFVVDTEREETAVLEANRLGIPVIGLVDTNGDPDSITHCVPGNDDAIRSIKLVTGLVVDAYLEGRKSYAGSQPAAEEAKKEKPQEVVPETPKEAVAEKAPEEEVAELEKAPVEPAEKIEEKTVTQEVKKKRIPKSKHASKGKAKDSSE